MKARATYSNISNNLKYSIAQELQENISLTFIAKKYNLSISSVQRIMDECYSDFKVNKDHLPETICIERTYGKSARETLLEEGFGALVGKVNEMLIENWASIAPSLGLVGVARFLPKTGRLGIARRILTGLGILGSAQELGAIRGEERAKGVYDPEHPTSTLVAGLASASLDVIGNLNVVGTRHPHLYIVCHGR